MASILEFVRKKENNAEEEDFRRKILKHRLTVMYRFFLAIVIAVAIGAIVYVQMKNHVYKAYDVVAHIDWEAAGDAKTISLGENILTYSKDGAQCIDREGTSVWNRTFEMQNPMIDTCEQTIAIGDYNGRTIYLMNSSAIIGEIDTKMPIRNFCVSETGIVAAVLDDGNVTWIYLFDQSGNTIAYFKTTMKKSGYPVSVTISDSGTLVGVSYLYMDSGIMRTSVAFFNFGEVGQNKIDNFVSSYDYSDTVVPVLHFIGNDRAVAVADNRLVFYEGDQIPVSKADVLLDGEIESVFYGDRYVALVYNDTSGAAKYRVDVYDSDGKLTEQVPIDMAFSDLLFNKDKMIVYNEQECLVHTVGGMNNYEGRFDKPVTLLVTTDAKYRYVVVTPDGIDTIELK